jgi:hypothetical protein
MPDLLRDPLAVGHAAIDRIDVAVAKLGMVIADVDCFYLVLKLDVLADLVGDGCCIPRYLCDGERMK